MKLAVIGLRHGHINGAIQFAHGGSRVKLVGIAEEDAATREAMRNDKVKITHDSFQRLLDETDCDIVAIGDYYGRRGALALEALRRGKHVLCDKPLCTSPREWEQIRALSREKGLSVGCQFDLRDNPRFRTLRRLVREGAIGEVHAVAFGGQHPLNYGTRAGWYFEPGKHGGTINDIAVHACDFIPWITGQSFVEVNAARNWNARLKEVPHFKDAAQMMMTLANGAGVLGDVSYLMPDSFGYGLPQYWRVSFWGAGGMIESSSGEETLSLYRDGAKEVRLVAFDSGTPNGYLNAFLDEIEGRPADDGAPTTDQVLESSRVALMAQEAADRNLTAVKLR